MINVEKQNNKVYLKGEIVTEAKFSHGVYGEGFYEMEVMVKRLSGEADVLPVTISERLIEAKELKIGSTISAIGQFRSYNKQVDGKSKLMLTVFIREVYGDDIIYKNPNNIMLCGYICKPPIYRTTPFNREIADLLIAVNRSYNKSDYIPCIAWGRNARFVKNFSVGDKVVLSGRIQSREYQKKFSDTDIRILTAYEVSVSRLFSIDNDTDFDLDAEFNSSLKNENSYNYENL